jgi:hypothetical protein
MSSNDLAAAIEYGDDDSASPSAERGAPVVRTTCSAIGDESYRAVAPKRLLAASAEADSRTKLRE